MGYVFTLFIMVVLGFICYRIFKGKSVPSTPYDDITVGKKVDIKRVNPLHDTKHEIQYEEKDV